MGLVKALAENVRGFSFGDIPEDVLYQTKRLVLDTIGCAIGGYESDTSRILQEYISESAHPAEATVFGSGLKTSCLNAALANGAMVRFLDYNDTAFIIEGENYRSGYHPSEFIPPIIALCEKTHLSGKDVITNINLGYDLSLAFLEGIRNNALKKRGWHPDLRGAYIMPLLAGKILGLTAEQMENAVGIAASCHSILGILDTPGEEYSMAKNIRVPSMAHAGIMAAFWAQKGFTGPERIIEGHEGFVEVVMGGEYDTDALLAFKEKFAIRDTCIKSITADFSSHGHLAATLSLVRKHGIKAEDVAAIQITTSERCAGHTGDPSKKYPKNKESADHSSYYLTAIAIIDHQVGPDQFNDKKYADPRVRELIDKITLIGDPSLDIARPAGISEIMTLDGKRYTLRMNYPKGHAKNPMTDEEIIEKFRSMASKHMSEKQMEILVETVFAMDTLDDIGNLTKYVCWDKN